MNPNSIVSFSNDSTLHSGIKNENTDLSIHDLAMHAMRDRCLLFQRRIQFLEDENMRLKLEQKVKTIDGSSNNRNDNQNSIQQLAELTKQKSQLIHHIYMVTCENKNLWNKLATMKTSKCESSPTHIQNNRLVRSNTYITDSSPNKDAIDKLPEPSLEEISLKLIDGYIKEKTQLVEQYEEMSKLQHMNETHFNVESLGFAYLDSSDMSLEGIKSENEKVEMLKNELYQQENDLRFLISKLEKLSEAHHTCQRCEASQNKQMSSVQTQAGESVWATPSQSVNYVENKESASISIQNLTIDESNKFTAENLKMCPMCGDHFNLNEVSFEVFQLHVEQHFSGEEGNNSSGNYVVNNDEENVT